jgi:hypothetical protein
VVSQFYQLDKLVVEGGKSVRAVCLLIPLTMRVSLTDKRLTSCSRVERLATTVELYDKKTPGMFMLELFIL